MSVHCFLGCFIIQCYLSWLSENPSPHFLKLFGLSTGQQVKGNCKSTILACKCLSSLVCLHMVLKVTIFWNSYSTFLAYKCILLRKCWFMHYEVIFCICASLCSTGGLSVENLGNVLGNRTQAWSRHLKKLNHQTSNVSLGTDQRWVGCSTVKEVQNK